MATKEVHERIHYSGGQVSAVEYVYTEVQGVGSDKHTVNVSWESYEQLARRSATPSSPFNNFVKGLSAFMMGKHGAVSDIAEAFCLLDTNHSDFINLNELAAFMLVIGPNVTPDMLIDHVRKVDKNHDLKMNLTEFSDFIMKNIERQIALGRL